MKVASGIYLFIVLAIISVQPVAEAKNKLRQPSPPPWAIRYLLVVDTEKSYLASNEGKVKLPAGHVGLHDYIAAQITQISDTKDQPAVLRLEFSQSGKVVSETLAANELHGFIDSNIFFLKSSPSVKPAVEIRTYAEWHDYPYEPANGDKPWVDASAVLCSYDEINRFSAELNRLHSSVGFGNLSEEEDPKPYKLKPEDGLFYCKHWARQIANPSRPWIDVTSYEKRGPRVRKFQGYGLFGTTKPVVGKHYKTWVCFADCPDGKPGSIADVKVWSKKYGLPVEDKNFGM